MVPGPSSMEPTTAAIALVGPTRLSRTACLWARVNRPAMDAPARWTTASTPSKAAGSGERVPTALTFPARGVPLTSRTTRYPPVERYADSAEPTSPEDPVTATVGGRAPERSGPSVSGQIVAELPLPVAEGLEQEPARYRRVDGVAHPGRRGSHRLETGACAASGGAGTRARRRTRAQPRHRAAGPRAGPPSAGRPGAAARHGLPRGRAPPPRPPTAATAGRGAGWRRVAVPGHDLLRRGADCAGIASHPSLPRARAQPLARLRSRSPAPAPREHPGLVHRSPGHFPELGHVPPDVGPVRVMSSGLSHQVEPPVGPGVVARAGDPLPVSLLLATSASTSQSAKRTHPPVHTQFLGQVGGGQHALSGCGCSPPPAAAAWPR